MTLTSVAIAGCGTGPAANADQSPANTKSATNTTGVIAVDTTSVTADYGTVLARIMTGDGHVYSFGHSSVNGHLVVEEMGRVGSPPTLPTIVHSAPSIVDIYSTLSKGAPVPSGLLNPERGTMHSASTVPPPAAPSHGSGLHPLTLTADQSWFQSNVCSGDNPGGNGIQIHYCDLTNADINSGPSQYVFNEYGYFNAGQIDSSAEFEGLIAAYTWYDEWDVSWTQNIPPGDWYYAWWPNSGDTYNASAVYGNDYAGPAALAMGTCCN
jgi:hypothetical protein